jgi:signal transduction histidine kinase
VGISSPWIPGNGTHSLRARLERLGGALDFCETPGGGTTVSMRVPISVSP